MRFYGGRNLVKAERDLVLATLKQGSNNRVQTAKVLGMPRSTLDKKLKQYAASGAPIPPAQNGGFRAARWSSQGPSERRGQQQGRRFRLLAKIRATTVCAALLLQAPQL
jgi:Bacterial regulatory protein, Fis family